MNKVVFSLFLALFFLSACKKENDVAFEKSPDERLNEAIASYQSLLAGAENGWKASVTLDSGRGATYSFYFKFNNENRVVMLSDFDSTSAVTPRESSYRLKALQQPSLLFDTYSYLHVLSDPDASNNGGNYGVGLSSDFEYFFLTASPDTINLVGRFNGSKAVLTKATQSEAQAYNSGQLLAGLSINKILTYFKRLTIGGGVYDIQINPANRTVTFTWIDANNAVQTFTTNYYLTVQGIFFTKPLQAGTQVITGFTNMVFNAATQTIDLSINNQPATITGIVVPLFVDVNAPQKWWNYSVAQDSYWITINGFHINGVNDAFNWASVPGYSGFTLYWAKFGTSGGISYDLLGPIVNDSLNFGAAYRQPTFTTDGRIVFRLLGTLGDVPASANASFVAMAAKMTEARGYYFVQIDKDGLVFDMVSATDGKAWIRWEWF